MHVEHCVRQRYIFVWTLIHKQVQADMHVEVNVRIEQDTDHSVSLSLMANFIYEANFYMVYAYLLATRCLLIFPIKL